MKFTVLIHSEDDSSAPSMVAQIERTGPLNAATFGLTLAESKSLLANVQKERVLPASMPDIYLHLAFNLLPYDVYQPQEEDHDSSSSRFVTHTCHDDA